MHVLRLDRPWLLFPWLFGMALMASPAPAQPRPADLPYDVLGIVEGDTLRAGAFETSYAELLIATGHNDTEALRRVHLEGLVDEILLAREAERRGMAKGETYAETLRQAEARALAARFFEAEVLEPLAEPTDDDLRKAYAQAEARVVLRHVVYRTEAEARAAYARVEAGTPLLTLAQERFRTAPDDTLAGYLGAASASDLDDAIAEAAFTLVPGTVSSPVRSRYGWHLIEVLDVLRNPLLTEADYLRRRDGLRSQVKARRRRLAGDRYIQAFMAERDVQVQPEAIAALARLVSAAPGEADAPVELVLPEQSSPDALDANTPLLTYTLDGQPRVFRLADYLRWLPALPAGEVRQRTAASVGRALRDEVLARTARAQGFADDPVVRRAVASARRTFLAEALRADVRAHPTVTASDTLVAHAAQRLGLTGRDGVEATFWAVPAASYAEGRALHDTLTSHPERAALHNGYVAFERTYLPAGDPWEALVARTPLGETALVGRADGTWHVLHVEAREAVRREDAATHERLRDALAPLATEAALLDRLRAEADIRYNASAFAALFTL